ncbi:type II toxin-antitoxin system RelE/ParE family toxin [Brevundimonas sp. R86498]|uniref:type II toxin-antitoxin system RelE/ParE family toxin n=1 Tax=Brevundimonas sp. R86498 TaxID=3093845 RepID=UPI0037CBB0A0
MTSGSVSRDAEIDLMSIFLTGMEQFGLRQAERYRDGLKRAFELLAQFPDMARTRPEWPVTVRAFPHGSRVIIYEQVESGILIVRVRHGLEDWIDDLLVGDTDQTPGEHP